MKINPNMYNDSRPKSASPKSILSERSETEAMPIPRPMRDTGGLRESGDIEQQMLRLNNNINEADKIFSDLYEKLQPILQHESLKESCDKDCAVEKSLSPLASDLRIYNAKIDTLKSRMVETIIRIQL